MKLDIYRFDYIYFNESSFYQAMSGKRIFNDAKFWNNYLKFYLR